MVALIMWGVVQTSHVTTYVAPEPERVVEVIEPEWAKDEDAVKAAKDVIRRKELEAELATLKGEIKERQTRTTEIEKELGTY